METIKSDLKNRILAKIARRLPAALQNLPELRARLLLAARILKQVARAFKGDPVLIQLFYDPSEKVCHMKALNAMDAESVDYLMKQYLANKRRLNTPKSKAEWISKHINLN